MNEFFGKANNCITCYGEYLLRSGECLCPEGKYDLNFICYNCNLTCKSCLTEGSFSCLSCKENADLYPNSTCICRIGYYMDLLGDCRPCKISCISCINGQSCLTCKQNMVLVLGFYKDNSVYSIIENFLKLLTVELSNL